MNQMPEADTPSRADFLQAIPPLPGMQTEAMTTKTVYRGEWRNEHFYWGSNPERTVPELVGFIPPTWYWGKGRLTVKVTWEPRLD